MPTMKISPWGRLVDHVGLVNVAIPEGLQRIQWTTRWVVEKERVLVADIHVHPGAKSPKG
jgi:hypothetical protein